MAPRTDISLDIAMVIKAAFDVLEKEGIEKLTMRRLAAELSVKPPAFYWHFKDKAELLSMMGETIYRSAIEATPPASSWREWLQNFGASLHRILIARRDSARVFSLARPNIEAVADMRSGMMAQPLLDLGLDEKSALYRISSVICLAVGWSTFNDNPAMHDMLGQIIDFEDSFQRGLEALIAGFPESAPGSLAG